MKEEIFQDCIKRQNNSNGKAFWNEAAQYWGYKSGEALRCAVKNEKKRRGFFDPKSDNYQDDMGEKTSYEEGDKFINVVCASRRLLTQEEVIKHFQIDEDIWEVERFTVKTSEGYRKDRSVEWDVEDGKVINGKVRDSGKMLVVPLYHIQVRLIKKKNIAQAKDSISALVEEAKEFAPVYPKINYKKNTDGCLYEISIPDIHFGRLSWAEESGEDTDIKLARIAVDSVTDQLLFSASQYNVDKILLPLGNDFFNTDTLGNTTTRGTPQQEDTRWQKTFREGLKMAVAMIDKCSSVAPVDVVIVGGNHDVQRIFYLGEALTAWYHNSKDVNIDNSAMARKYYGFGKNLIGFTHGHMTKTNNLPLLMAMEVPELWAKSIYREVHIGHSHHKKDIRFNADESSGVVVRILRSLAVDDAWTFLKGFKSLKAAEAFLWHPENGMVAQFTAQPIME